MQISKNTSKISVGILIFLMMASIAAIAMPSAKAQVQSFPDTTYPASSGYPILGPLPAGVTPQYTFQQVAYISVQPTTVGLNQQMLINVWTSPGMYHTFYGQGFTVDIIKPD